MHHYYFTNPVRNNEICLNVKAPIQELQFLLRHMKHMTLNVRKAKYHDKWTELHIGTNRAIPSGLAMMYIADILHDKPDSFPPPYMYFGKNSTVRFNQLRDLPFTAMYFTSIDRVGILSDIIEVLLPLGIDIHSSQVDVKGNTAYVMLIITKKGTGSLSSEDKETIMSILGDRSEKYLPDI